MLLLVSLLLCVPTLTLFSFISLLAFQQNSSVCRQDPDLCSCCGTLEFTVLRISVAHMLPATQDWKSMHLLQMQGLGMNQAHHRCESAADPPGLFISAASWPERILQEHRFVLCASCLLLFSIWARGRWQSSKQAFCRTKCHLGFHWPFWEVGSSVMVQYTMNTGRGKTAF